MRVLLLLTFALSALSADHAMLPDPKLTPGAADPRVTQANVRNTICKPGYTKTVRHVSAATKREVMRRYGLPVKDLPLTETDHLLSLELGGSNDVENLWPQYYEAAPGQAYYLGAREKDVVENYEKRRVCSGASTLKEAQEEILHWPDVYRRIKESAKK